MKPISLFPPPAHLRKKGVFAFRVGTGSSDGKFVPSGVSATFDLFEEVDSIAPYVVYAPSRSRKTDGPWADLEPDYLAEHDGYAFFIEGNGKVRARLSRIGMTKKKWEALGRQERLAIKRAVDALEFVETAITTAAGIPFQNVQGLRASSHKFLKKFSKLAETEQTRQRGVRSRLQEAAAFRHAARLVALAIGPLEALKRYGVGRFDDIGLEKKVREINALTLRNNLGEPCQISDLKSLLANQPLAIARRMAAREQKLSGPEILRFKEVRYRPRKTRKPATSE